MQHKMWSITLDEKLHLAPIGPNPQNVLDIGTGTGIWAIEFGSYLSVHIQQILSFQGECYPSARVIGTDLSLIQPAL
jgi:ubiquinone/menaquinone biosynthesis C-methylase UbiE